MALSNFSVKTIKSFFNDTGSFYIPNYQRDYAWDHQNEVNDLWQDILTVYNDNIDEYFLGQTVIFIDENKTKNLIDGQQRSTTLFLLFLAMKHNLDELINAGNCSDSSKKEMQKTSKKIENMLGILDEDDYEDSLFLGENDKDFFRKMIYETKVTISHKQQKLSRKKLVNAYNFFRNRISEILNNPLKKIDDSIDIVCSIYKIVCDNLKLLYIETNDESEAFMIFETLNARGRDLETSDLLKNYLFKTGATKIDSIKNNWNFMANYFETASITSYIRCLWNSQHDFCRDKILYKRIKEQYRTPKNCLEFSEMLKENAILYLSLLEPSSYHHFSGHDDIEDIIYSLSTLGNKSYYPLVIAFYNQNKTKVSLSADLKRLLSAIQSLMVRDIVISKMNPSSYEPFFSKLAQDISEMTINNVDEIITKLKDKSVDDNKFKANFLNYSEQGTTAGKNKIRFILRSIVNYKAQSMKIKTNNNQVHIEHIMPQSISKWNIDKDIHKEYLWYLGNLTLLSSEINETIQNDVFTMKKEEYKKSDINITLELANYNDWNEKEILKRQEELYEIAKDIWSFK